VLAWVAEGKTNPEIAQILGLSPRTVGNHLARIYARLGVQTRTAAARVALTAR
jgi:DNA-binding CsgD family transcriptional regulator